MLTDEQVTALRAEHGWAKETIRAIETAIIASQVSAPTAAGDSLRDELVAALKAISLRCPPYRGDYTWDSLPSDFGNPEDYALERQALDDATTGDIARAALSKADSAQGSGDAAAPQAVPLTEERIRALWDGHTVPVFGKTGINPVVFARAIERAHGIAAPQAAAGGEQL